MRFEQGEIDVISRLNPATFAVLEKQQQAGEFRVYDLGPGFEYDFLFFNLNDLSAKGLPSLGAPGKPGFKSWLSGERSPPLLTARQSSVWPTRAVHALCRHTSLQATNYG